MIDKDEHFRLNDERMIARFADDDVPEEETEDEQSPYASTLVDDLEVEQEFGSDEEADEEEWDENDGPSVYGWAEEEEW